MREDEGLIIKLYLNEWIEHFSLIELYPQQKETLLPIIKLYLWYWQATQPKGNWN